MTVVVVVPLIAAAGLLAALGLYVHLRRWPAGDDMTNARAAAIRRGARLFLTHEYARLGIFVLVAAVAVAFALAPAAAGAFVAGAIASGLAGAIGMAAATRADGLRRLAARRKQVKCWLMDQATMAGLGNIYSDEVLFQARLHPKTPASSLPARDLERLYAQIERVCDAAVDAQVDPARMPAGFLLPRRHAGGRCPRCDARLERLPACGRTAYRCPRCQPGRAAA